MLHNLLGGIAWGFGTVLGATVVVALVVFLFDALGGVPYIGNLIREIVENAQTLDIR